MADEVRLIDANALHKEITSFYHSVIYKDWVQSAIASAPTISDVVPVVHGRWEDDVYTDPYGGKWTKYRCSLCGRIEVVKEPYCNCGAKMDLEEQTV